MESTSSFRSSNTSNEAGWENKMPVHDLGESTKLKKRDGNDHDGSAFPVAKTYQKRDKGNVFFHRENVTTAARYDTLKRNVHSQIMRREKYSCVRRCRCFTGPPYRWLSNVLNHIHHNLLAWPNRSSVKRSNWFRLAISFDFTAPS